MNIAIFVVRKYLNTMKKTDSSRQIISIGYVLNASSIIVTSIIGLYPDHVEGNGETQGTLDCYETQERLPILLKLNWRSCLEIRKIHRQSIHVL